MIDLAALTPADRSRPVRYTDAALGYTARGVVTSWNERVVFVRYWVAVGVLGWCAQATNPEDLEWED